MKKQRYFIVVPKDQTEHSDAVLYAEDEVLEMNLEDNEIIIEVFLGEKFTIETKSKLVKI